MSGLLRRVLTIGAAADDDEDTRLRKFLLLVAAFTITPLAAIWGATYWIVGARARRPFRGCTSSSPWPA